MPACTGRCYYLPDMKILIAPNSFKECADSVTIAELVAENLRKQTTDFNTNLDLVLKPLSDGGDGFLEVCNKLFDLKILTLEIPTPYKNEIIDCEFGYSSERKTIFIESAKVLGLKLIPVEFRHPAELNSIGLGRLLLYLQKQKQDKKLKIEKVVIGIGGTGTSDFGIGMMSQFNLELLDENGESLEPLPVNYTKTKKIKWEKFRLDFAIEIISDVKIPLLGPNGTSRLFAPQKGATEDEVLILEQGLKNILKLLGAEDKSYLNGAGGGLAGAFQYFFDAKNKFADEFINSDCGMTKKIKPDVVITGEGQFDYQSNLNKAVGVVLSEFAETNIPIFIICGKSLQKDEFKKNITIIELESFFQSKAESILNYLKGITLAAELILKKISL